MGISSPSTVRSSMSIRSAGKSGEPSRETEEPSELARPLRPGIGEADVAHLARSNKIIEDGTWGRTELGGRTGSLQSRADLTPRFEVNFLSVPEFPCVRRSSHASRRDWSLLEIECE